MFYCGEIVRHRDKEIEGTWYIKREASSGWYYIIKTETNEIGLWGHEDIVMTGNMKDFGKHPFKNYYLNKVLPQDLDTCNLSHRPVTWMQEMRKKDQDFRVKEEHDILFYHPNVDNENPNVIIIWPNDKAREKGKKGRQAIKPGKFFRMLLEDPEDTFVEHLVEKFKEDFLPESLEFRHTKDADGISEVYQTTRANQKAFETTEWEKRLSDSCMRYSTDHFGTPVHPTYAFGSGDFTLFYAVNERGFLAARCLAYFSGDGNYQLGPIYASSKDAIKFLRDNLPENVDNKESASWEGARILRITDGDGDFVGPFFDIADSLTDDGDFLVVDSKGKIEHSYSGVYSANNGCVCGYCYESVVEDDTIWVESEEQSVCDYCYELHFFRSDFDSEVYRDREEVTVLDQFGRELSYTERQAEMHAVYSTSAEQFYTEDAVVESYDGDYIPTNWLGDGWKICSEDGLAYPEEDTIEHEGKVYAKDNAPEESEYCRCNETERMAV